MIFTKPTGLVFFFGFPNHIFLTLPEPNRSGAMTNSLIQRVLISFLLIIPPFQSIADEGMWPPSLLNSALIQKMKEMGFQLSPEALYSTSQPSLKDAIVLFGRGCTGEIISSQGLVLTNHHCGFGQIQNHSSIEHDYLKDGFWAKSIGDELPNPGLTVSILVRMENVSEELSRGVSPGMPEAEKEKIIAANTRECINRNITGTHFQAQIKPFFGGIQQWILVYETFTDIRLVGAPPGSIGKFGGDTDNWVWPRHTGDFSLFRIYAGKDNKPAPYSKENIPFTPRKYLPVSTAGVKEGDFTMLIGYPGRTSEYLPSYALNLVAKVTNPKKINLRTRRLEVINAAMKASQENRIRYADKQADIANAWKKWQGELLGMNKANAIGKKEEIEERYRKYFESKGMEGKKYLDALENLRLEYRVMERLSLPAQFQTEAIQSITMFGIVNLSKNLLNKCLSSSTEERQKALENFKQSVRQIWKDCDPDVERDLFGICMSAYHREVPRDLQPFELQEILEKTPLENDAFSKAFFDKGKWFDTSDVWTLASRLTVGDSAMLKKNPSYRLWILLNRHHQSIIQPQVARSTAMLEENQKIFFQGLTEMDKSRLFYPDANQTFRIAFGKVSGYQPADGIRYGYSTNTAGILEKVGTADDFQMDEPLKSKFQTLASPVPVAFIASNHSTGGNSGSPVLNAKGELIGLNFDRVWEGTMSDYFFDGRICRNISCDVRYILWVIENIGKSNRLIKEMEMKN